MIHPPRAAARDREAVDDQTDPAVVGPAYRRFYRAVAEAQLDQWLPPVPSRILDLSAVGGDALALTPRPRAGVTPVGGPASAVAGRIGAAGHRVVQVLTADAARTGAEPGGCAVRTGAEPGGCAVRAEPLRLDGLADASVDGVVAEGCALSQLALPELTFEATARVLRPGGRLLVCVESLVHGLAELAEDARWAELADVPAAEVVLVPRAGGTVSRCFWPGQLREALEQAGLTVEWIRPRTVLTPAAVHGTLAAEPDRLDVLVATELALTAERGDESVGEHLVASARRPER